MLKRVQIGSSSSPPYVFDEEARIRLKHQGLLQDYVELQKETNATKKKLKKAKQRKQTLLSEVRFLRRRYQHLMEIQTPKPQLGLDLARTQIIEPRRESFTKERSYREREAALPNSYPLLDLNQISNEVEEAGEFQGVSERPIKEKSSKKSLVGVKSSAGVRVDKQLLMPPPPPPSDLKLSVCRDTEKGSKRGGKRKISWQDPVALRV